MYKTNYFSMDKVISKKAFLITLLFSTMMLTFVLVTKDEKKQPQKLSVQSPPKTASSKYMMKPLSQLPMHFEKNEGQVEDENVKFLSRGKGYALALTLDKTVFLLSNSRERSTSVTKKINSKPKMGDEQQSLEINLVGSNLSPLMTGVDELPGKSNYFIGNNPEKWITGVKNYSKVRYSKVYDGIDLIFYGNQEKLEYDFIVSPGANPNAIAMQFEGCNNKTFDENCNLILDMGESKIVINAPTAYQKNGDNRERILVDYAFNSENHVVFNVGNYNPAIPLVIDPVVIFSTYLDQTGAIGHDITTDTMGNIYLTGWASNFPVTDNAAQKNPGGNYDAFIAKMSPDGSSYTYATYLGGEYDEFGYGIAVDLEGYAYITGETQSENFPTYNAVQSNFGGGIPFTDGDAFVAKLNPTGSAFVYSTFLGGTGSDIGHGIAVDKSGNANITGFTTSYDFPTDNALDSFQGGYGDAFVTKINSDGSDFIYSTYLGGNGGDEGYGIAVDRDGNTYVTGQTGSSDFPTVNPYKSDHSSFDAFVTKINTDGSAFIYSTYLGGEDDPNISTVDKGTAIAVDTQGCAYIAGETFASNFPVVNPIQPFFGGGLRDGFVTKLSTDGSSLLFSTYLGGNESEFVPDIVLDQLGNIYITGETTSNDFPTNNAIHGELNGYMDAFIVQITSDGSQMPFSTYLGGSNWDQGYGITADKHGYVYVTGKTISSDFPTENAMYPTSYGGGFVVKLLMVEKGILTVVPNPIVFPLTLPGEIRNEKVQLINSGSGPLQIINIDVEPTPLFTINNKPTLPLTLDGGFMVEIDVTYSPLLASAAGQVNYMDAAGAGTLVVLTDAKEPITSVPIKTTGIIVNKIGDQPNANINDGQCDIDPDTPGNQCTLRAAIQTVNANQDDGIAKVIFMIPDVTVPVIKPESALPEIEYPVELDGSTQTGGYVVVDGSNANQSANGLTVKAGNSIINSLNIVSFEENGIYLTENGGNIIDNCVIEKNYNGIRIFNCSNDTVKNSIISDNRNDGIYIEESSDNVVENCKIGTDVSGMLPKGNYRDGIRIFIESLNTNLRNNVISGNARGVRIIGSNTSEKVKNTILENNKIGTSIDGNEVIPNKNAGIYLLRAYDTQIKGNIISGNGVVESSSGIEINTNSNRTIVENNLIGTNSLGAVALSNNVGIYIDSDNNRIAYNVISGNAGNGITLGGYVNHVSRNYIHANKIGTDKSGEKELGNGGHGIEFKSASKNIISKNTISGNSKSGIFLPEYKWKNEIFNNNIGTDSIGMKPLGNLEDGITIMYSQDLLAPSDPVGELGLRVYDNIISANNTGIFVSDSRTEKKLGGQPEISLNYIGTDKNKKNPNANMGNYYEGIEIDNANSRIENNHIGFNKTGILYKGLGKYDKYSGRDHQIFGNQIYNNETGLIIYESYPKVLGNHIYHNVIGVDLEAKDTIGGWGGKIQFINNKVDYNTGSSSGIHIKNAWVLMEGNSISHDAGNAITVETASKVKVSNNNIFSNQGYGLNNLAPLTPIDGQSNWWGDAGGPGGSGPGSGDEVSAGVNFSNWLAEMVSLVTTAELDTVIMPSGETDTLAVYFQNWESMLDVVDVQIMDGQGWLQSPASFFVSLDGTMGSVAQLAFAIPQSSPNGMQNHVEVISTSQTNTADVDTATFVIVAQQAEISVIAVYPDSIAIVPGDSISFTAIGFDQFYRTVEISPQWSCTGGVIDGEGFYFAGNETGIFKVTATEVISGLTADAIVNITYAVSVDDNFTELPTSFQLFQNYPNPFNPTTKIRFSIPSNVKREMQNVVLKVYDVLGNNVATLVSDYKLAGSYEVEFDASNLASGIYVYKLQTGSFIATKKMILLR